jgi:hypothetical protein
LSGTYPISDKHSELLKTTVTSLETLCKTLDQKLEKYALIGEISASNHDAKSKYLKNKLAVGWKRVRWDQSFIDTTRKDLDWHMDSLFMIQQSLTYKRVADLDSRQQELQVSTEQKDLFHWLTSLDFRDKQATLTENRQIATGEWYLETEEFGKWIQIPKEILFCYGIPGSGKTMIVSKVIEYLSYLRRQDPEQDPKQGPKKGLAYIFQNVQASPQPSPTEQLLCLLKQLLHSMDQVPDDIIAMCRQVQKDNHRLNLEQTKALLRTTIDSLPRCFIIVDALDEYYLAQKPEFSKLIDILSELQQLTNLNLLVTSRPMSEIQERPMFHECLSIEIEAHDEDIELYVEGRMKDLTNGVMKNLGIQKDIKTAVSKASGGM